MPIEFDDARVSTGGVDDRRGRGGGGLAIGGGTGVVGLIIFLAFQLLGGGNLDLSQITPAQTGSDQQAESSQELEDRCNADGALQKYTDCRLIKVYNIADQTWKEEFDRLKKPYESPRLAFFKGQATTGCGNATADVGPFYCPPDEEIFFDLDFLDQLQTQFGAQGEFAQAYILAHEFGHHLQTLLGTERKMRAAQQSNPDDANKYSVALELQADCYAGVWAKLADQQESGIDLTAGNIAEAQKAASAVGDDRIQKKVQGRVNPESWTHGSAAQRSQWFTTGYSTGDINSCNTFGSLPG